MAHNMLTVLYAKEIAQDKISALSVSPGYRATGLSNGEPMPSAPAAEPSTGQFFSWQGEVVAW